MQHHTKFISFGLFLNLHKYSGFTQLVQQAVTEEWSCDRTILRFKLFNVKVVEKKCSDEQIWYKKFRQMTLFIFIIE